MGESSSKAWLPSSMIERSKTTHPLATQRTTHVNSPINQPALHSLLVLPWQSQSHLAICRTGKAAQHQQPSIQAFCVVDGCASPKLTTSQLWSIQTDTLAHPNRQLGDRRADSVCETSISKPMPCCISGKKVRSAHRYLRYPHALPKTTKNQSHRIVSITGQILLLKKSELQRFAMLPARAEPR